MNGIPAWLKRMNESRTGLWAIVYPKGRFFNAESFIRSSPRDVVSAVVNIINDGGSFALRHRDQISTPSELTKLLNICECEAVDEGRRSIRVFIMEFHEAPAEVQCALVKSARGIQETATQISWQFVFCGHWSYYAFRAAYFDIYSHTNSPPAHSKDVIYIPSLEANDVLQLLADRRIIGVSPTEIDCIAADFVVEQTAGDEFLIGEVLKHLEQLGSNWTTHIEEVLNELTRSADVVREVTNRLNFINVKARTELVKLLLVQRLIRDMDSVEAEQLWIAGLASRHQLGSGKQCLHLACPLTNIVLRRILNDKGSLAVALPEDLNFERTTIAGAAYCKISQIENMLRNLVVACWHAEVGVKWSERLSAIKTLSHDQEEAQGVLQLVEGLIDAKLVARGISPQELPNDDNQSTQPRKGRQQESLLDAALDWQKRQQNHHAVEICNDNLMQFLTTEALMSVLVNRRNGLHGQSKPFARKEFLITALEEYIAIRSAVAHNQTIKLSTLFRLDELHRKFVKWLTVYADSTITLCAEDFG